MQSCPMFNVVLRLSTCTVLYSFCYQRSSAHSYACIKICYYFWVCYIFLQLIVAEYFFSFPVFVLLEMGNKTIYVSMADR